MPRVVRIIARLNVGGPAIHAVLATAGLNHTFPTVLVTGVPGPREGDMRYFAAEHGVTPLEIPELGREISPLDDVWALLKLIAILRRERPDVVHTHTAKAGTLGRIAALVAGVPIRVHTFHGHVFDGYFPAWKAWAFLAIERVVARFTDRVLTLSEGLRDDLSSHFRVAPASKITVVPLGLDLHPLAQCEMHRGELRRELGIPPDAVLVGIVGRMVPVKNHGLFFRALAELVTRESRPLRAIVVGSGELEAQLRPQVDGLGLSPIVHFLGWRRDLERIYADLDVVALTSLNEGTPVALIEAMAAGVPVVSTAVGGAPDLLREGERGELVSPPFSPVAVASGIQRALAPSSRQRAARFRRAVLDEYGAERLCRDLEQLYRGLLAAKGLT
ncbi:MAG: glycosyltransferase [Actinobacteria bacterium]|nr:glycosyltransferase [Actinomycetota bacterium]